MSPSTRKLGRNGPEVTALGLGLMGISIAYGPAKPDAERLAFLDHVFASGEHNWDTSSSYGDSELLIGQWFKQNPGKREQVFLATKFGSIANPDGTRGVDNRPEWVRESCENSLKRLGVDYIDLFYCHRLNGKVPIEVVVEAMAKLKEEGKVKYLGLSEVSATTLRRACKVAHIDAVQMEYSPWAMEIEQLGLLKAARETGTALIAYSPLGRGFVNGKFRSPDDFPENDFRRFAPRYSKENFPINGKLVDLIHELAKKKDVTAGQLTLAWLMAQGDDIIPIPGTTRISNFDENMGSLDISLTTEEVEEVRKLVDEAETVGERYPPMMAKYLFMDTPEPDKAGLKQ